MSEPKIEVYDYHGRKIGLVKGTMYGRYGPIKKINNQLCIQPADIKPADGSPTITAYVRVEDEQ